MKALYVKSHSKEITGIKLEIHDQPIPTINENECLIKVSVSGINPSDALATTGYFKHAVLPRIPGRDFSGTIVDGPAYLLGKNIWGTGGAAGISFDGTQAEYIKLPVSSISEIPHNLDLITAGAQPLPYVTAYYSLVKRANIKAGESVLVVGALGQVGRCAMSICEWKQCNPIALVKGTEDAAQAKQLGWKVVNSDEPNLHEKILEINNNQPIHVIFNSVGNIYWNDFMSVLAEFGRIITIGARENTRNANINLFDLYRANQEIIGVNTVSFDFEANAQLLDELKEGFEQNKLTPLRADPAQIYSPADATQAYQEVLKGVSSKRIIIRF